MEENSNIQTKPNSMAIASFVLGLCGIIAWLLPLVGYPVTILGIVFGAISRKTQKNGFNMAGLILSIIFLLVTLGNSAYGVFLALGSL